MTSDTVSGILAAVADEVARSRDTLNRLDAAAGDGDLGVTMFAAAAAVKQVASEPQVDLALLLRACGMQIAKVAPSTCGTLVATGFLAAARRAYACGRGSHRGGSRRSRPRGGTPTRGDPRLSRARDDRRVPAESYRSRRLCRK
jgi:hypothetical protein